MQKRVWLTFPSKSLVESPILWRMSTKFPDVVFDIRQSSFQKDVGIMAILFEAPPDRLDAALKFLASQGVTVEPIEKTIIEG
jgi:hypothetical protein